MPMPCATHSPQKSYILQHLGNPKVDQKPCIGSAQSYEMWSEYHAVLTYIGQFPICDGLSNSALFAYFKVPRPKADVRRAFEWSWCCPLQRLRPPHRMDAMR